jgi:hypothetical protein
MKFKRRHGEIEQGCVLSESYTATGALPPILPACRQRCCRLACSLRETPFVTRGVFCSENLFVNRFVREPRFHWTSSYTLSLPPPLSPLVTKGHVVTERDWETSLTAILSSSREATQGYSRKGAAFNLLVLLASNVLRPDQALAGLPFDSMWSQSAQFALAVCNLWFRS